MDFRAVTILRACVSLGCDSACSVRRRSRHPMTESSTGVTAEVHRPRAASWLLPLLASFLAFFTSPICIIHFCSAGSRVFEVMHGVAVTVAAGVFVARSASRRILITVLAPVASFALTMLYFAWIHSSLSPWPAHDIAPPDFTLTPK
jgi:hypothetical protein